MQAWLIRVIIVWVIKLRDIKVVIEHHSDGFVAYPLNLKGVVVAQGDTYEEALENLKSAIAFHAETFGSEVFEDVDEPIEVFVETAGVSIR